MAKMNHLTKETRALWAAAAARDKVGLRSRAVDRAGQWMEWKAEQLGLSYREYRQTHDIPAHARPTSDAMAWHAARASTSLTETA